VPEILYDVCRESPPTAGGVRGGIAGVLLGFVLLAAVWKRRDTGMRVFALVWVFGWAGLTAWSAVQTTRVHREGCGRLSAGDYQVVEGEVEDFTPATLDGKTPESFRVGNKTFRLSPSQSHAGLNRPSSHGGPIKGGERLRIAYNGPSILRVERVP